MPCPRTETRSVDQKDAGRRMHRKDQHPHRLTVLFHANAPLTVLATRSGLAHCQPASRSARNEKARATEPRQGGPRIRDGEFTRATEEDGAAKDRRETPDADDQRPANQPFHHTAIGR